MIVSFRHRFIFVAIPKTATHALRTALRPHLGRHDWEQCILRERKAFPIASLAAIEHGHLTCEQVRPFLRDDFWNACLRFCVVRNPYDRFLSYCRFVHRDSGRMRRDPRGVMKESLTGGGIRQRVLLWPQHEFVTDANGDLLVNRVYRFERLQSEFEALCLQMDLPPATLPVVNASHRAEAAPFYDRELAGMVQAAYSKDFAMFDYSPDPRGWSECQ